MASTPNNQAPAFAVIALILFAAANPLCHAQLGSLLNGVGNLVPGIVNSLTPVVPRIVNSVTPVVPGIVNSVTPVVPGILNGVTPVVPGILNGVTPAVPAVVNGVTPAVPAVVNGVTPAVPAVVNGVTPAVPAVVNGVTPAVPAVVNGVTPAVPAVLNGLTPAVPALLNGLVANGILCCTPNGNCPAGATGLAAGIPITLNCTNLVGGTVTVGTGSVGANGGFNVSATSLFSTLGGPLNPNLPIPCRVVLPLPLNQTVCNALSNVTGALTGAVSAVQGIVSTATGGLFGIVTVPSFSVNATARG